MLRQRGTNNNNLQESLQIQIREQNPENNEIGFRLPNGEISEPHFLRPFSHWEAQKCKTERSMWRTKTQRKALLTANIPTHCALGRDKQNRHSKRKLWSAGQKVYLLTFKYTPSEWWRWIKMSRLYGSSWSTNKPASLRVGISSESLWNAA